MINKKAVLICTIISIIIVGFIIGWRITKLYDYKDNDNTIKNEVKMNYSKEINEIIENNINTDLKNENQATNTNDSNLTENTNYIGKEEVQEKKDNNVESSTTNNKNNDDIALKIVKDEWGKDDTVYYTVDSKNGNLYNISVRSKSTTATLVEYEVNIETKSIIMK